MNIIKSFDIAFKKKDERGWEKIYVVVDMHDTIIKADYNNTSFTFFPYAQETLSLMSKRDDIVLILWSSSHDKQMLDYYYELKKYDIQINWLNENPEEKTNELSKFDDKFYFNVGLDDKFGFEAEKDWKLIFEYFQNKI